MFTGIIQAIGCVSERQPRGGDVRLFIQTGKLPLEDVAIGDSVAVNGVCLTATQLTSSGFWADASAETLTLTTLGELALNGRVNLEKSLTPTSRLGGHLVSGHVDGIGEIIEIRSDARSWRYRLRAPQRLARYIATKGSICIDGVSLTVNGVDGATFDVNIVPHTYNETIFQDYRLQQRVNLEVDLIARYLERLVSQQLAPSEGSTEGDDTSLLAALQRNGFLAPKA